MPIYARGMPVVCLKASTKLTAISKPDDALAYRRDRRRHDQPRDCRSCYLASESFAREGCSGRGICFERPSRGNSSRSRAAVGTATECPLDWERRRFRQSKPHVELTNSGGGPAVLCRLVVMGDGQDGWLASAVDIPPGSTVTVRADQVLDGSVSVPLSTWNGDDGFNHNVESLGAIFAKDILGTRHRFLVVKDGSSRAIIERKERWRLVEDPDPSWAKYRVIWPDYGTLNS